MNIVIGELVTRQRLTGDRRLSHALAECDARGLDALPLAPRELDRLFPGLWETEKAAERWLAKNPPEAHIDIIRVWGVLNTYRPPGQSRWSKALVRHGADPRSALAAVLGVDADDLHVKDGGAPNANTAPSRSPPRTPTPIPIRSRGRTPITPCQALLLETPSEGVRASVEAVAGTPSLVLGGGPPRGRHRRSGPRRKTATRMPSCTSALGEVLLCFPFSLAG
jgi:hypothetical protein